MEEKYNIKICNIKKNKEIMKKFIVNARKTTNVTLVELADIIGISKSSVAKYAA